MWAVKSHIQCWSLESASLSSMFTRPLWPLTSSYCTHWFDWLVSVTLPACWLAVRPPACFYSQRPPPPISRQEVEPPDYYALCASFHLHVVLIWTWGKVFSLAGGGAQLLVTDALLCLVLSTFISFNMAVRGRSAFLHAANWEPLHLPPPNPARYDRVNGFSERVLFTGPAGFCWASEPITVIKANMWIQREEPHVGVQV